MIASHKKLIVLPTSRSIREAKKDFSSNALLPTFLTIGEFESRALLINDRTLVDPLSRSMLLREAARFDAIKKLHINFDLVRFFTKSDAIFKFFEELAYEKVPFEKLKGADVYDEFGEHIDILQELRERYGKLLKSKGLCDKTFLPEFAYLNEAFIKEYDLVELHIEGYLSRFELDILDRISKLTQLNLFIRTSKFTAKMQQRFSEYGFTMLQDIYCSIDFSQKKITYTEQENLCINTQITSVNERSKQIAAALFEAKKMVDKGIDPEDIAIILPDESYKEMFHLFDQQKNLNFAMGFDYTKEHSFKILQALDRYFKSADIKELKGFAFDLERLALSDHAKRYSVDEFFAYLSTICKIAYDKEGIAEKVYQNYSEFCLLFTSSEFHLKEWLFLWLKSSEAITLDDNRGGKITVIGALETRGVHFKGIIIVDFNEGIIPSLSAKDQFLNSAVRTFADLPTRKDREALQKQLYKRVLEQAQYAAIIYTTDNHKSPSRFIYELSPGGVIKSMDIDTDFFYNETCSMDQYDPVIAFDAQDKIWSSSMLEAFLTCKRKYYFRYIKDIKSASKEEMIDGVILHDLFLKVFAQNDTFENRNALALKMQSVLEEFDLHSALGAYKKLAWMRKLEHFIDAQIEHFQGGWRVAHKELEVNGTIAGLRFQGRVDRVDVRGGEALILDYKSGKTDHINKTERSLESNYHYQMNIYARLLAPKYPKIETAYVKIFDTQQFEPLKAAEEKDALLLEHITQIRETKEITASRCEDSRLCKYCDYALACQRGEYI